MIFNHIGMITNQKKEKENFVEATRVWVTDFNNHPFKIEWLRFADDSPVTGPVREQPHVAYQVENLETASQGLNVLLKPFDVGFAIVGFYETEDGGVVELMKYK